MNERQKAASPSLLIPSLGGIYRCGSEFTYPMIRFVAGAMLVPHGWVKLIGGGVEGTAGYLGSLGLEPAYPLAVYLGLLELLGGTLLALGLVTRLVAIQVVGFMAVAAFYVHWPNGFLWVQGGFEYPLFWGVVALAIFFRGGGKWSLDELIGKEF